MYQKKVVKNLHTNTSCKYVSKHGKIGLCFTVSAQNLKSQQAHRDECLQVAVPELLLYAVLWSENHHVQSGHPKTMHRSGYITRKMYQPFKTMNGRELVRICAPYRGHNVSSKANGVFKTSLILGDSTIRPLKFLNYIRGQNLVAELSLSSCKITVG